MIFDLFHSDRIAEDEWERMWVMSPLLAGNFIANTMFNGASYLVASDSEANENMIYFFETMGSYFFYCSLLTIFLSAAALIYLNIFVIIGNQFSFHLL